MIFLPAIYTIFFLFPLHRSDISDYELLERIDARIVLSLPAGTPRPELPDQAEMPDYQRRGFAGKGANGEVWRARAKEGKYRDVVLKRIYLENKPALETSTREIFFGQKFGDTQHISRFVRFFTDENSLWLVFVDEGYSLYSLLFTVDSRSGMMHRSSLWNSLRDNPDTTLEIFRQVLEGLDTLNSLGIVHRDIKLENIFVKQNQHGLIVRIGDFGSAYSAEADFLYPNGISISEETARVSAPEPLSLGRDSAFDIFSLGISFLELFLGRLDLLEAPADGAGADRYARVCISRVCSSEEFSRIINSLDPLHQGTTLLSPEISQLIRSLISEDPHARPSARAALHNRIFQQHNLSLSLILPEKEISDTCPLDTMHSATNQGARSKMEDRVVTVEEHGNFLACVLDGHNGVDTVNFASEYLKKNFRRLRPQTLVNDLHKIYTEISWFTGKNISGCTATCVARVGDSAAVAHVGDTRALAVTEISDHDWRPEPGGLTDKGNLVLEIFADVVKVETSTGRVTCERHPEAPKNSRLVHVEALTRDHKATDPEETRNISAAGGRVEAGRVNGVLAISRSFGAWLSRPYVTTEAEISEITFPDFVVICSDGVFDVLENQRVAEQAAFSLDAVIEEALKRGARDNLACAMLGK